ncbi:hypothetical protein BDR04DRAFT_92926 [Suillus decipiens]|nr:hypothetical protein BDR04DRAFT_92926 [Suillus decipiens]
MGLVSGTPTYMSIEGFAVSDVPVQPQGRLFAYTLPTVVRIFLVEGAQLLQELGVLNIIDLQFSPRRTCLSTWGNQSSWKMAHNIRISACSPGLPYTMSESYAIRLVAQEIQVYRPAEWGRASLVSYTLKGHQWSP